MKDLVKIGNSFNIPSKTYITDFEEDLDIILKEEKPPVGSIVEVINTGIYKKYKLGNGLKWYEIPIESSGGGCNPEDYKLQEKNVVPSTAAQAVTPDDSYYGLSKVNVNKIPENYITTDDANATPEDLMIGKTAYVQGQKITGIKEDEIYVLPLASENELGGIKASEKDELDVQECKINTEDGKLYTQSFEDLLIVDKIEGSPAMSNNSADWRMPLIEGYGKSTQGADPTPEAPQEIKDSVVMGVKVIGENLFDIEKAKVTNTWIDAFYAPYKAFKISVKKGEKITIFYDDFIDLSITTHLGISNNEEGKNITVSDWLFYEDTAHRLTKKEITITTKSDVLYLVTSNINIFLNNFKKTQANYGDKRPYRPYKEKTISLSAPVILRGIPSETGNVTIDGTKYLSDYIGQKEGVYGVFRKTQEMSFTGAEPWSPYTYYQGFYLKALNSVKSKQEGMCNQAKVLNAQGVVESNTLWIGSKDSNIYFLKSSFYSSDLPDQGMTSWKAHLAEDPLKIITVADEEVFEPLPEQDSKALLNIKTFYPTSIISGVTEDGQGIWVQSDIVCDPKNYINNETEKIKNEIQSQLLSTNIALLEEI